MAKDMLSEAFDEAINNLAARRKGSVKKAQNLAKTLRQQDRKKEAQTLIRKANEAARFIPRNQW